MSEKRKHCEKCDDEMDTNCNGDPRCPTCDGPCPCCYDGPGPGEEDEDDEECLDDDVDADSLINTILRTPAYKAYDKFGAQMGRRSQRDGEPEKLHVQRLKAEDHDYDLGGAYWGSVDTDPIWCGFSDPETSENDPPVMVFVRAMDIDHAKEKVVVELKTEGWTFFE